MAKKKASAPKKKAKKKLTKYQEKFKIDLPFEQAIKILATTPKKRK